MTKNLVWALSNLCRGKNPPPDFSKVFYVMFPDAFLVKSIGKLSFHWNNADSCIWNWHVAEELCSSH